MVRNVWGLLATFPPAGATYVGEKSWASPPTPLANTHTCGHLWGQREGGSGSNAAEVPRIWGEADVHRKYLETEQRALPQGHPWAESLICVL